MMEKLMTDTVVLWAKAYKVDGFRFDLMNLHTVANAVNVTSAVQALTLGAVFVVLATLFNGTYALLASSLRHILLRGRALPFVRRYVSGTVFVSLGVLAARAGHNSA